MRLKEKIMNVVVLSNFNKKTSVITEVFYEQLFF